MPNPAVILLLAAAITTQPAPAPDPVPQNAASPSGDVAQQPNTNGRAARRARRAAQPQRPTPPPRIGVRLDEGPAGEWRISAVVPFSPAHRAGLRANDLILKVRGEDVSFDDPERFRELFDPSPVILTIERDGEETLYLIHKRVFPM
jgi:C-terminal processing protease CtpA/Prc